MIEISEIVEKCLFLIIFFLLILLILFFGFKSVKKKKGVSYKYLIGFFSEFKTKSIISLSLVIINFVYLCFLLVMKLEINYYLLAVSPILIFISFLLLFNFKYLFINVLINFVNIGVIYLGSLINTLKPDLINFMYIFLQIVLNITGILLYLFTTLKFIKNIGGEENNAKKIN